MASTQFERYGEYWSAQTDALSIEFFAIRKGGTWLNAQQKPCGLGLFHHYKQAMTLLWPEDDWHRWAVLFLDRILANKILGVMGPQNSNKTYMAAKYALTDYFAFPENTGILVSSTDLRGLELRVWGTVKQLFNRAIARYDLPGVVLESMHTITTDDLEEDEGRARVLKKGIICIPCLASGRYVGLGKYIGFKQNRVRLIADECFPRGTLVDTANGQRPIESIHAGDSIVNCLGLSRVLATSSRTSAALVRMRLSNGLGYIDATPNHPFLTSNGWKKCVDIHAGDYLISTNEAMYCLQNPDRHNRQEGKILLNAVSNKLKDEAVQMVQHPVCPDGCESNLLFSALRSTLESQPARDCGPHDRWKRFGGVRQGHKQGHSSEPKGEKSALPIDEGEPQENEPVLTNGIQWRSSTNTIRANPVGVIPDGSKELPYRNRKTSEARRDAFLQAGLGVLGHSTERRGRWPLSQQGGAKNQRPEARRVFERVRVDRVEILEPKGDPRYDKGSGGYRVHNLQIEGHHSYSIKGLVVKNCQLMGQSFLDAVSNLGGNLDFKGIFLGNPLDPLDPLGLACEPENGWTSHPEPTKTTVWKTRFKNGECLNFVGTDSPNFDFDQSKAPTYAYLIHKARIEEVEAFWGKDSQQYFSQVIGVMKSGLLARRIITADLCREHHALEKAVWKDEKRTKIYAVDIAYGSVGGDRCVSGWGEFGEDKDGLHVLRINPPVIVPVSIKLTKEPEDQIAEYVWKDMNAIGIPASNGFYDSTGRGTMGNAFVRVFKSETLVPVEFGGRPSKRPVRHDLFVYEGRDKRHKRCDEHYWDFISELYFSSRYIIECDQMRELPDAVMREGCRREYGTAAGNRLFIESKHDPKARERMGRSPDFYDWLVTLCEGARQRGFIIQKLGLVHTEDDDRLSWLDERRRKTEALLSSKSLAYK